MPLIHPKQEEQGSVTYRGGPVRVNTTPGFNPPAEAGEETRIRKRGLTPSTQKRLIHC